ncbi:hypothetical protein THICB2_20004 [Thiomonas sp. CB2]|nr:hypothetical protein THICB2_20004 [Thiomonas sp. CB2]VDY10183.1 protein of unknown function [Thiomonas sp. Sup16B3]
MLKKACKYSTLFTLCPNHGILTDLH